MRNMRLGSTFSLSSNLFVTTAKLMLFVSSQLLRTAAFSWLTSLTTSSVCHCPTWRSWTREDTCASSIQIPRRRPTLTSLSWVRRSAFVNVKNRDYRFPSLIHSVNWTRLIESRHNTISTNYLHAISNNKGEEKRNRCFAIDIGGLLLAAILTECFFDSEKPHWMIQAFFRAFHI